MLSLVNCDLSSAIAPSGSSNRRARAVPTPVFDRAPSSRMRSRFNLIKMVPLRLKELSLIDRCIHDRVVICCEWDVRAIRLKRYW